MPRKKGTITEPIEKKKVKKNLMNVIVNTDKEEHIVLQLPLSQQHIDELIYKDIEYDKEPEPYEPKCYYISETEKDKNEDYENIQNNGIIENTEIIETTETNINCCCYWCCHLIEEKTYNMPINYNNISDTFTVYGIFCSLQCANAYNFSIHTGSDKVWEINSLIQMMGKRFGINYFIRPAPSRYLLKMFNGTLTIEEFRKTHISNDTTHLLNIPPIISITTSYEILNTSCISKSTLNNENNMTKSLKNKVSSNTENSISKSLKNKKMI